MNYYTVYLAKNDQIVACGTSHDCQRQLGLASVDSFYSMVSRVQKGTNKKYEIYKEEDAE